MNIHTETPLFDALEKYRASAPISCHVPGHKNGMMFAKKGKAIYQSLLSIDATEVEGLDDLHAPEEAIFHAEQLLSGLYGSQRSFFLVNGSTCGNLAMILGNCKENDVVLVQRNCHKSILHGLMLAKAKPVFINTAVNDAWGIAEGVTLESVEKAINMFSQAKAIILTYPTYYGHGGHISDIIEIAKKNGLVTLVDEAHGAHFVGKGPFLKSSLTYGADYVVQSAHKTLPAMTMGSYLHVHKRVKDFSSVQMYLQMLQSSSPSYPIMASLDLARSYIGTLTDQDLLYTKTIIESFRKKLHSIRDIRVLPYNEEEQDILKVTIQTKANYTGFQLQKALQAYHLYPELADMKNVLLVLPILKDQESFPFDRIVSIIEQAMDLLRGSEEAVSERGKILEEVEEITTLELSFSEMMNKATTKVALEKTIGCIIAETIIPYPPGVPYVIKGERISEIKILGLKRMIQAGTRFHSTSQLEEEQILVYI